VDLDQLTDRDYDQIFYKEEPYSTRKLEQRLLITYSPKYAAYQKEIREKPNSQGSVHAQGRKSQKSEEESK